jgi:malonate-semialdehyde dehydrogenase (acetylating)/methylmalonate-semialdehyde dehydrogenase
MEDVRYYAKLKTVTARCPTGIRASAEFAFTARNWAPRFSLSS